MINDLYKRLLNAQAAEADEVEVEKLVKAIDNMQKKNELLRTGNCDISLMRNL